MPLALGRGRDWIDCDGFRTFHSGIGAMKMSDVHERKIAAPAARVSALLDTLASADDKFWPHENWPGVKFNLPLQVGATGGHGTGPYAVMLRVDTSDLSLAEVGRVTMSLRCKKLTT